MTKKVIWPAGFVLVFIIGLALWHNLFSDNNPVKFKGDREKIKVIMDDNYPPYVFRTESGKLQGILIDYWQLWEEKTGVKVEITGMDWEKALIEMKQGSYDVIDTIFYNEERARFFDFSKPYATIEVSIFFHQNFYGISDAESLKGFIVGVKKGDASEAFLREKGVKNLIAYDSYKEVIEGFKNREILVFVMDKPPALYYLYKYDLIDQFKISPFLYTGEFHRAVSKGDRELLNLVEAGFALISADEYRKIEDKWMGQNLLNFAYMQYLQYLQKGILIVFLILLVILLWNYLLQREVAKKTEELRREKELLSITLSSIGDGVVTTDREGRITSVNRMATEISGFAEEEAKGRYFSEVFRMVNEETGKEEESIVTKVLKTGQIELLKNHICLLHKEGLKIPVADSAAPIKDSKGDLWGTVVVFRDITREKEHKDQIIYFSYHDILTGLYNRRFMEEKINLMEKENIPVTVIMGDVNGLKLTNDVFGHEAGDRLLKKTAEILKAVCQEKDFIARWGGDEFLLLLPFTTLSEGEDIIRQIKASCNETRIDEIKLSISLGCAVKIYDKESIMGKIKEAEERMYRQKLIEGKSYRHAIIESLLATLFVKSMETKEHTERIKDLCLLIGERMKLSIREKDELTLFALLHDIGKVGIEEDILLKPGSLTEEEWQVMKKHSEIGYRIALNTPELAFIAEYILYHHERYDGKGYPQGLKGKEIPLLCRILSVADAYDAMTQNRVYRAAMSKEDAVAEIEKNRGKQFDPEVVDIFLNIV